MSDQQKTAPGPAGEAVRSIDPAQVSKHFDAPEAEARWDAEWQASGVYRWDPARAREETYVVDTPPPTASGSLHIGHVFSYTQADVMVRFKRMLGMNIFYPMGWDDNGLPTERRVQNYYHVRCDPNTPYEAGLEVEEATAKVRKKPARLVSRPNFIEICYGLINEDEDHFRALWRRLGLSVDWDQEYQTIDDHCRRTAQLSFLDLWQKGRVYSSEAPTMWDVDFQTAVAQAEAEDRPMPGAYHHIEFAVEGSDDSFVIATTRPELLAACVGVTAHPDDDRYKKFFGSHAITPLFKAPVPIFPSELADPEKGTGVLMVCTFGDATDVQWWREQSLALRQVVGRNGRMLPIEFGTDGFPSHDPAQANRYYAELEGKNVKQAQKRIVELLAEPEGSATGGGPPLRSDPEPIEHPVKFYERGERPLEHLPTRQWFARLMDHKDALLAKGEEVDWYPPFMHARFRDWTENLSLDWCLSRQRYFGVPIPVWYPLDAAGEPDYENPIIAEASALPVDPTVDIPPGHEASGRGEPGGFVGDPDVFDTWFTSSLSPQISSHWGDDPARHAKLFPADVRPQGHDIIRTWAFYTIAKAFLHEDTIPWKNAMISGWILDPDRKKMSKSKGKTMTPLPLLEKYSADAGRYWAASARLGSDTVFDEKVWGIGKRLVTKIFNAGKFVLAQTGETHSISVELDRAFVAKLAKLAAISRREFEVYNYAHSLQETETFFWTHFTDTYLELVKARARKHADGATGSDLVESASAVASLRLGLSVLLRLFAPVLPYITEEIWSWSFAEETGHPSIHQAPWPGQADFAAVAPPEDASSFDLAVAAHAAINKAKADAEVSMGREVEKLTLLAGAETLERLGPVLGDVVDAARCLSHTTEVREELEAGVFVIEDAVFAPKPEKKPSGA